MPPFDMSLVQRGARLRRSPFFEAEQRHGPRGYTMYNHMLFPTHYDDFEKEYWHLLTHVTLWDVAVERCLEVSGKDGFRLAQLMTPRDLSSCAVGQAKYVLICAADGGILNSELGECLPLLSTRWRGSLDSISPGASDALWFSELNWSKRRTAVG